MGSCWPCSKWRIQSASVKEDGGLVLRTTHLCVGLDASAAAALFPDARPFYA